MGDAPQHRMALCPRDGATVTNRRPDGVSARFAARLRHSRRDVQCAAKSYPALDGPRIARNNVRLHRRSGQ